MLKRKLKKLLLNPYRIAKKDSRIKIDASTVLLDGVRFDFRDSGGSVKVGRDSLVGCNFIFESDGGEITIGERCHINSGTHLIARSGIKIGNDVNIAWGTYVYDNDSHSLDWRERAKDVAAELVAARGNKYLATGKDWSVVKSAPITICDKAWIGFEVVILKGVTIGEGAVVGARAVVGSDVPAWTVVAGNPARVIKSIEPR